MIVLELPIFLILVLVIYVEILTSVLSCLYVVPSLLELLHNSCIIIAFFSVSSVILEVSKTI